MQLDILILKLYEKLIMLFKFLTWLIFISSLSVAQLTAAAVPDLNLLLSLDLTYPPKIPMDKAVPKIFGNIAWHTALTKAQSTISLDLEGKIPFGYYWHIKAGSVAEIRFTLPVTPKSCRLKLRELGLPAQKVADDTLLLINDQRVQQLSEAQPQIPFTHYYGINTADLKITPQENILRLGNPKRDLGVQHISLHCTAALPSAQQPIGKKVQRLTLLAPVAGQIINQDKKFDIAWQSEGLPSHARLDLLYRTKTNTWEYIHRGVPYNHPFDTGNRGLYRWKAAADAHPQLQVQLQYNPAQAQVGCNYQEKITGLKFCYLPAGCFKMNLGNKSQRMCVDGLWIAQTELTHKQYTALVPNHRRGYDHPQQPVTGLNFNNVIAFTKTLSQRVPGATFRLPTEVEWEYAARANKDTIYPWGNIYDAGACNHANISICGLGKTDKVAQRQANAFGLYDVIGNAAEWTCSSSAWNVNANPFANINTCNQNTSSIHYIRGGYWHSNAQTSRFNARNWRSHQNIGIRLLMEKVTDSPR
ncbi:hypothetical protein TI05_07330 [Achromatium sp. WMS3]|nr:hypothetical protein TI05_07330 [Achromatium sp. WMS3]